MEFGQKKFREILTFKTQCELPEDSKYVEGGTVQQ